MYNTLIIGGAAVFLLAVIAFVITYSLARHFRRYPSEPAPTTQDGPTHRPEDYYIAADQHALKMGYRRFHDRRIDQRANRIQTEMQQEITSMPPIASVPTSPPQGG